MPILYFSWHDFVLSTPPWYNNNRRVYFVLVWVLIQQEKLVMSVFPRRCCPRTLFPKDHSADSSILYLFLFFNFISILPLLNANKIHAIKKYILEDMKKRTSCLLTLLAMMPLFSTLMFPSLKLAFYDSSLSTDKLLMDPGMVPPCKVTNLW